MQFEILPGLKMIGLFFMANATEKKPMVMVQHGSWGTPEQICGIYGDTANYNDMLQRVIRHNVHAFAPQLLLWHEDFEVVFDRALIDARLKRVGSSITAVEIFGIMRILDYFERQTYVSDFGMVGMSYGGFYTMYTAAIDKRIKSALSCSQFCTRDEWVGCDWTWFKSAEMFDDAEIACLVYPRKLCIEVADKDGLFDWKFSRKSYERIKEICADVGTDWIDFIVFNGEHEFNKDDMPIENLIKDLQ